MGVTCAKCGEPLMGAVNRCWKCGQHVLSTPDAAAAPPQRRAPVALKPSDDVDEGVVTARLLDEADSSPSVASPATNETESRDIESHTVEAAQQEFTDRRHAAPPPVFVSNPAALRPIETIAAARPADYRKGGWVSWMAIASVALGVVSILGGAFAGAVIVLAALGLACGIIGVQSRRRSLAIVGLLLCLFGTTISSVRLAYDTYTFVRGESPLPMEEFPEDDFSLQPFDSTDGLE